MVRKLKDTKAVEQLKADTEELWKKVNALEASCYSLEFKIKVATFNYKKVNVAKLNEYIPKLDALYAERLQTLKEFDKLNRRLDRIE